MVKERRALMIYPEFPENSYWNMKTMHRMLLPNNEFGYPKGNQPPLGLLCIAPVLQQYYGRQNMRLIDMNIQSLSDEDIEWADDIYLSYMLTQSESAAEVALKSKEMGKTVIAGGPGVEETTEHCDYKFINESELCLPQFLERHFKGEDNNTIQIGGFAEPDQFFSADYSWINPWHYASIPVQFSRGCPHNCEFCDITIRYGRRMRVRDTADFFKNIQQLYDLGWRRQIFIIDDNFIGKPREALKLLKELKKWQQERHYPLEFYTQASVLLADTGNEELLKAFAPAGFSMIFLGIETPNLESLKETNKSQNIRGDITLAQKVQKIQSMGRMLILGGFIVGFDSDDKDIFESQLRFVDEIGIPTPMVGLLHPLPGTRLEERLKSQNRLLKDASGGVASGLDVNFQPHKMTSADLQNGYKNLLLDLYTNMKPFYDRCLNSLQYVAEPPFQVIFKKEEIIAILMMFYHEGFKANYRKYFWRYVFKMILSHPKKIPYGLRWAAFGLHYNRLTHRLIPSTQKKTNRRPVAHLDTAMPTQPTADLR